VESSIVIPDDLALRGLTISTQGMHLVPSPGLTRRYAPDLGALPGDPTEVVYSNAIDFQVSSRRVAGPARVLELELLEAEPAPHKRVLISSNSCSRFVLEDPGICVA
jgi:hypothetical protein